MQVVLHIRFLFGAERDLNPGFKVSAPLRSVQSRCPQDILHPIFRRKREVGPWRCICGYRTCDLEKKCI